MRYTTELIPAAPGTPAGGDLMTPDLDAARLFYEQLFGWHLTDLGPDAGGYQMADVGGKQVAGLGPQQEGQTGHPAVWTTYLPPRTPPPPARRSPRRVDKSSCRPWT